jgi:hypothetical protein
MLISICSQAARDLQSMAYLKRNFSMRISMLVLKLDGAESA